MVVALLFLVPMDTSRCLDTLLEPNSGTLYVFCTHTLDTSDLKHVVVETVKHILINTIEFEFCRNALSLLHVEEESVKNYHAAGASTALLNVLMIADIKVS